MRNGLIAVLAVGLVALSASAVQAQCCGAVGYTSYYAAPTFTSGIYVSNYAAPAFSSCCDPCSSGYGVRYRSYYAPSYAGWGWGWGRRTAWRSGYWGW